MRSLPQAIEEIARERGISVAELYRQSGSQVPAAPAEPGALTLAAKPLQNR